MTPASALASLDRQLASHGEDVVLQRVTGSNNQVTFSVTVRAMVRAISAEELAAGIAQTDSVVILSPTQIAAAQWPGPSAPPVGDARLPRKGDRVVVQGRLRNVDLVKPIYLGSALVRIELRVLGAASG